MIDIAKTNKASICVLHIYEDEKLDEKQIENKKLLEAILEGVEYKFHFLSSMQILSAINCFVESRESDMIAFINKKHAFFGSILTKPLVKGIGFYSKVPILVMHDLRN